jgi:hypothetical protein
MLMSRRDMNSFGPVLENVSFRNTRFDPNQTRFGAWRARWRPHSDTRLTFRVIDDCYNCSDYRSRS